MTVKSMNDLFLHTLKDIYYAEKQIYKNLPKMAKSAKSPDLKRAFEQTKRYDLVIVAAMSDGDPSLAFFAGAVDHIVLVARAEQYGAATFAHLVARLGVNAQKILGAVLTGAVTA